MPGHKSLLSTTEMPFFFFFFYYPLPQPYSRKLAVANYFVILFPFSCFHGKLSTRTKNFFFIVEGIVPNITSSRFLERAKERGVEYKRHNLFPHIFHFERGYLRGGPCKRCNEKAQKKKNVHHQIHPIFHFFPFFRAACYLYLAEKKLDKGSNNSIKAHWIFNFWKLEIPKTKWYENYISSSKNRRRTIWRFTLKKRKN